MTNNASTVAGTTTGTSYTVSGLTQETNYTFTIKAKDAAGNESLASNGVTVTTNGPSYNERYTYDQIGNLKTKAGVDYSYGANGNGTGSGPHQARTVGGQSYRYDANGNLLQGGGRSYTWNRENQPTSITGPDGVQERYTYDAEGRRVTRTRNGVTTIYLSGMVEEEGGTIRRHYGFGGQAVAQRTRTNDQDTLIYLHGDHIGSIAVATSSTTPASVVSRQEFTPWGEVRRIVDVFVADLQGQLVD